MRGKFLVVLEGHGRVRHLETANPAKSKRLEPNLDILTESPCLRCGLFMKDTTCTYVKGCSKIDEFQRLAAVHCTLCKPQDLSSAA